MTVADLKRLLIGVPDDLQVFWGSGDDILGGFRFTPACECDSGVVGFGEPVEDEPEMGFVLFPHGIVMEEGDEEEDYDDFDISGLN